MSGPSLAINVLQPVEILDDEINVLPKLLPAIDELSPSSSGIKHHTSWDQSFEKLKQFKKIHGHCNVQIRYVLKDGQKLGKWVSTQRTDRKNANISQDHIDPLNDVGFVWDAGSEHGWLQCCAELKQYKKDNGHCLVPQQCKKNPKLGKWVNTQRTYRKNANTSQDRIDRLNGVGFVWDAGSEHVWLECYAELRQYNEQKGDCVVPCQSKKFPKLGKWVSWHRLQYKHFQDGNFAYITQDHIDRLDEIGFVWKVG